MDKRMIALGTALLMTSSVATAQLKAVKNQPADAVRQVEARKSKLMVGDKAPQLQIEKWVKGEPITGFEKGRVYVVEFWATWCGPCIAGMPHLTELQKKYKDQGLTIIGCTSNGRNNSLDKVEAMVKDKGDVMGYTVAWDTERKTNEAYMKAAGQNGIPCAFMVDQDGKIAYIGHPARMDKPLEAVMAGEFDLRAATTRYAREQALEAQIAPLMQKLRRAQQQGDWDQALAAVDELIALDESMAARKVDKFNILLLRKKDYAAAYEVADEILVEMKDDAMALNSVAWWIADEAGVEDRNLEIAMKAAKRASKLTDGKNASILDTLARVYFETGDTSRAIEIQKKAVELASDPMRKQLEEVLERYLKARSDG